METAHLRPVGWWLPDFLSLRFLHVEWRWGHCVVRKVARSCYLGAELTVADHGWCAGHSSTARAVRVLRGRKECRSSCPRERATLGESHPPCDGVSQLSPYLKTKVGVAQGRMQVIQ